MHLGWLGKRRLLREGYVQVRGAISPAHVQAALRAINRSLGQQGLPPERLGEMRARTYCPELISAPEILDLYAATRARAIVASAVGRVRPPGQAQIALRFPQSEPAAPPVPHIDGISTPDNGVPPGTLHHFTALLAVFLSDVTGPRAGNFLVWPRSHRALEVHCRRHGVAGLAAGFPALALLPPRPLTARAGDVVLAHYALAHAAAPNLGPHVRYAVFFRLYHQDHDRAAPRPLDNLWQQWEGMPRPRPFLAAAAPDAPAAAFRIPGPENR
jgi:Phytanoyl-CoA dioxygenase (PhyH)